MLYPSTPAPPLTPRQVAQEIWICEKEKVTKWDGDILGYKNHLKNKVMREANKDAKSKFFLYNLVVVVVTVVVVVGLVWTLSPQRRVWTRLCESGPGRRRRPGGGGTSFSPTVKYSTLQLAPSPTSSLA